MDGVMEFMEVMEFEKKNLMLNALRYKENSCILWSDDCI